MAVYAVKIAVLFDGRHEMGAEVFVGPGGLAGKARPDVQQRPAGAVAFGDGTCAPSCLS